MAFAESTIRTAIEVLHDGATWLRFLSEKVKDQKLKTFFLNEASHREKLDAELENALSTVSGKEVEEGGMTVRIQDWLPAVAITQGRFFRAINKGYRIIGKEIVYPLRIHWVWILGRGDR